MAPKLYGFTGNPRTESVKLVAAYEGVSLDFVETDKANKSKEFTDKFPLGLMPAIDNEGKKIVETIAVAFYVANLAGDKSNLFGQTIEEKTAVLQWASFANANLLPALGEWFTPIIAGPYNKKSSEEGKARVAKLLGYLDQVLADKTWLVGQRVSYADILVGAVVQRGCDHVIDDSFISQFPNVKRHFNTILNQPQAKKVYPNGPKPIAKPKEYVPEKKEKAAKAPAAAAAAAPAAKAPKKKEAAAEDDGEEPVQEAPKAKHPCEALGKPTMVLDEWKRQYSNKDTPEALKWFEENYKPEEYSLYLAKYKYPEELSPQVFMCSNLIGGFHTRLEGSRKYLFGNACVYGEGKEHAIQGVYLCRGQDWLPVFEVGPDYESYEFTKLDFSKPEDKEIVSKNWQWEDEVNGLKAADGKVFK